eukprot:5933132-Prorocentrum_lima.AAC.1
MLTVPPMKSKATVTFKVVDVPYPIFSAAKLAANGHKAVFEGKQARLQTAVGIILPLVKMRGLWYLLVVVDGLEGVRVG